MNYFGFFYYVFTVFSCTNCNVTFLKLKFIKNLHNIELLLKPFFYTVGETKNEMIL